jgi:hypothetical protein
MKFKYDAVYTQKYVDKNGEEKKMYTKIGAIFERDDGSLCMKLLDSWVNFYEPRVNEGGFKQAKEAVKQSVEDDEIPF